MSNLLAISVYYIHYSHYICDDPKYFLKIKAIETNVFYIEWKAGACLMLLGWLEDEGIIIVFV